MIASRFTKVFQLIALVLAFAVGQLYVMAGPINSVNNPTTSAASSSQPKAETVVADSSVSKTTPTTEAAAEKMTLRGGSKSALNRIFSKRDVEARIAGGNTFLKANTSMAATFKAPNMQTSSTSTSDDSDHSGRRGTWIAVGVIAAVLTIAVIGLRHDRSHPGQEQ